MADALQLPFPAGSFDVVTVAFGLRNMADWPAALGEMGRVLRAGGHLLVLDFSLPKGLLRPLYRFYLHRFLPCIAGVVTGERDAYQYLGASIEKFPSGDAMCELLERSGLSDCDRSTALGRDRYHLLRAALTSASKLIIGPLALAPVYSRRKETASR